jgi:FeS assembly protein IscX
MHWSDIEDIVEGLEDMYSEEEIPEYDLEYMKEMVLSLPEFEDQEVAVSKEQLKQIAENWLEFRAGN